MSQNPPIDAGLLANLVARVILAIVGIMLCWVPFRLLVRNGEFAAVVWIVDVVLLNIITILNSLIWHDDNWSAWWNGSGLCDVEVYLLVPLHTAYAASIFAIMYHLAQQVKCLRLWHSRKERIRRNLIQAAIIFTIPLVQLIFTYFDLAQRYIIGTLVGCIAVYDSSWPKNIVFDAPPAVFAVLSVPYAVLLWKRYDAISKQTQSVFDVNSGVSVRANRTRRRLYYMSLSILVIYLPIMLYYLVISIKDTSSKAYDYHSIHQSANPYPWSTILFVPSWIVPSAVMNEPWVPIATTVPIVFCFGTGTEAMEMYSKYAKFLGIKAFSRKPEVTNDPLTDDSTGTQASKNIMPRRPRDSIETHQRGNVVLPSIEQPEGALVVDSPLFSPPPRQRRHRTPFTPPLIPPRQSSLRPSFGFRAPTLRSIKDAIRIPSLRGRNVSATSNITIGSRTGVNRDDSIPMLPLYTSRRARAAPIRPLEPLTKAAEAAFSGRNSRLGNHQPVRIPIIRQSKSATDDTSDAEGPKISRDHTISTLFTASDTLKVQTRAIVDRGEVGIAK